MIWDLRPCPHDWLLFWHEDAKDRAAIKCFHCGSEKLMTLADGLRYTPGMPRRRAAGGAHFEQTR